MEATYIYYLYIVAEEALNQQQLLLSCKMLEKGSRCFRWLKDAIIATEYICIALTLCWIDVIAVPRGVF